MGSVKLKAKTLKGSFYICECEDTWKGGFPLSNAFSIVRDKKVQKKNEGFPWKNPKPKSVWFDNLLLHFTLICIYHSIQKWKAREVPSNLLFLATPPCVYVRVLYYSFFEDRNKPFELIYDC